MLVKVRTIAFVPPFLLIINLDGYHHRTEINMYRLGSSSDDANTTESDITKKQISPMVGFPHYGIVKKDFLKLKGSIPGTKKLVIAIRKSLMVLISRRDLEKAQLKFNDTSRFGASFKNRVRSRPVHEYCHYCSLLLYPMLPMFVFYMRCRKARNYLFYRPRVLIYVWRYYLVVIMPIVMLLALALREV